jgi:hypothetical protein
LEDLGIDGNNIRMDFMEIGGKGWTGFIWLRIGIGGRLF